MKILQVCPPHLSHVATLPWETKKVIFNSIILTYFWLFMLSQKETNCNPLAHPIWKCHRTNLRTAKLFHQSEGLLHSFTCWKLWKEPAVGCHWWLSKEPVVNFVMCGNWNVRKAMFRVTTFCINTCFKCFSTLFSRVVHHAVLKFSPCRNKPLPHVLNTSVSIHSLLL